MSVRSLEDIIDDLAIGTRNDALEAAAQIARLYGAPEEACRRILMLKATVRDHASDQHKHEGVM